MLLGQDTRPHFQGSYVALKRLRQDVDTPEAGSPPRASTQGRSPRGDVCRRSLLSEGQIAQGLSNPHVVKVDGLIAVDGDPVVVMEYIEGFGLDQLLTLHSGRGIPGHWVGICLLQLALALKALHKPRGGAGGQGILSSVTFGLLGEGKPNLGAERGIVHQDLKPSNIRVTPMGIVKVLDLGIAAPLRTPLERIRQGTPGYRSPEQIKGALSLTPSSDLYTLGILGFELSTGRRLFPESLCHDLGALAAAQKNVHLTLQRAEEAGELPIGLRPILERLLSRGRGHRLVTAEQAEDALRAWIGPIGALSLGFQEWCESIHEGLLGEVEGSDISGGANLLAAPSLVPTEGGLEALDGGGVPLPRIDNGAGRLGSHWPLALVALAFAFGLALGALLLSP